jgi:preprotein translocase subunit SecG
MSTLVTILFIITALLLIGVVLIQQPKTAGGLFAGTGQSLLGTSGKTFWTKFTTILAAVFMGLCLLMTVLTRYQQPGNVITGAIEKQQQQTAAQAPPSSAAPAPAAPPASAPKPQDKPAPQSVPAASNPAPKK